MRLTVRIQIFDDSEKFLATQQSSVIGPMSVFHEDAVRQIAGALCFETKQEAKAKLAELEEEADGHD